MAALLLIVLLLATGVGGARAEGCAVPPGDWSQVEKRAWTEAICLGKVADFDQASAENAVLTSRFINDLFQGEKWRKALPPQGVRISRAIFPEALELDNIDIDGVLWLEYCYFQKGAALRYIRAKRLISFRGSVFNGPLNLVGSSVQSSLFLTDIKANLLDLRSTKISEHLYLERAEIMPPDPSTPPASDATDDQDVADWGAILAYQAHVNGDVVLIDTVGQRAVLNNVEIGGRIKFDHRKNWKGKNAVAPPSFDMIDLQLSHIKGGADFRKVTVPNMLLINDTTIDGNLEFFGSTLKTVAANNLTVSGTFRIAPNEEHPVKWLKDSALVLPNANLTKFQIPDSESAWPSRTDLRNLGYREFDFVQTSVPEQTIIAVDAPVAQFSKWLSLSQPLSPQPYVQLAQELKTRGYEDYAKEIRITERERARAQTAGLDWVWETTKYYLIGHGYDLSGAWIAAASLLVLGRIVLLLSPIARRAGFGFAYSLDLLAPVIELRKRHFETELEPGIRRYYYVHRILGFIIASFLVAGITGLAKLG